MPAGRPPDTGKDEDDTSKTSNPNRNNKSGVDAGSTPVDRQRMFASMFFGRLGRPNDDTTAPSSVSSIVALTTAPPPSSTNDDAQSNVSDVPQHTMTLQKIRTLARDNNNNTAATHEDDSSSSRPSPHPTDRKRMFASMFFGRLGRPNDRPVDPSPSINREIESTNDTTVTDKKYTPSDDDRTAAAAAAQQQQQQLEVVLSHVDAQIPHDPVALRQTALFQGALQLVQYQRDNYLVGNEYADWRQKDRQRLSQQQNEQQNVSVRLPPRHNYTIPYDPTAYSHPQLAQLAASFVPSPTVRAALTPIVADLPRSTLYDPARNALVGLIHGQTSNLEYILKEQVLQLLDSPGSRQAMKSSTQGMMMTPVVAEVEEDDDATAVWNNMTE